MSYTGTETNILNSNTTNVDNLILSDTNVPINFNLNADELLNAKINNLENQINVLKNLINELSNQPKGAVETGTIHPYAGNAIDMSTYSILPPPQGYAWCFGQIVSKTDEKYANLYSVIGNAFNKPDTTIEDGYFQLPDLRNVFLRGCPEYIENSEENRLVGNFQNNGAPNITGSFYSDCIMYDYLEKTEGAFIHEYAEQYWLSAGSAGNAMRKFSFNANLVSESYQDGLTEVRPDNIAINYIIKL